MSFQQKTADSQETHRDTIPGPKTTGTQSQDLNLQTLSESHQLSHYSLLVQDPKQDLGLHLPSKASPFISSIGDAPGEPRPVISEMCLEFSRLRLYVLLARIPQRRCCVFDAAPLLVHLATSRPCWCCWPRSPAYRVSTGLLRCKELCSLSDN